MEPCSKATEIGLMQKDILDMKEDVHVIEENIEGNGKPGIKAELIMIKDEQRSMNNFLRDMNTNVSAVVKFMIETQTVARIKLQTRDVVNMILTLILSASAIAVAYIIS